MKWLVLCLWILAGCASVEEETEYNPNIPAAAHAADSFPIHFAPPEHGEWEGQPFYFQECGIHMKGSHVSKSEYMCSTL